MYAVQRVYSAVMKFISQLLMVSSIRELQSSYIFLTFYRQKYKFKINIWNCLTRWYFITDFFFYLTGEILSNTCFPVVS